MRSRNRVLLAATLSCIVVVLDRFLLGVGLFPFSGFVGGVYLGLTTNRYEPRVITGSMAGAVCAIEYLGILLLVYLFAMTPLGRVTSPGLEAAGLIAFAPMFAAESLFATTVAARFR